MTRLFLTFISLVIFCSCTTLKSKQRLVRKGFQSIENKKYFKDSAEFTILEYQNMDLTKSALARISKSEIKTRLKNIELFYAMIPDSTKAGLMVDSFYTNPNKIKYIKNKNLVSENIHFIEVK